MNSVISNHHHGSPPGVLAAAFALLVCVALTAWGCASRPAVLYDAHPHLRPGARPELARSGTAVATPRPSAEASAGLVGLRAMIVHQLEHSPRIAAARERLRAAMARVPQAAKLPNLAVELAWLPLPVETRVGPNNLRVGVKQMIPFPTKLAARIHVADAQARRAAVVFEREVRDAITELKLAYADVYYYDRAQIVLARNEAIAAAISSLGATRQAKGHGVLADVARAQAQLAQLQYDRVSLSERGAVARARVNALLGQPADTPFVVETLPSSSVQIAESTLIERALAHQQELATQDRAIEAAEAKLDLAEAAWLPDLAVGAQWMRQTASEMRPEPADSGQDALAVSVGVSLPLWGYANAAAVDEAEAELVAALYEKQQRLDGLPARVRGSWFKMRNAARLRDLYDKQLLPHARAALETADQTAQGDAASYADLLEARAAYYSFMLARERAAADHFQAVAQLEQLVGTAFAPADLQPESTESAPSDSVSEAPGEAP